MTTAQRDTQTNWDQAHIIFNTTENCLQIYTGIIWQCLQQGMAIDSSIYKHNGTLRSDRTVIMNGSDLTFDGSRDIIITDDGRLGIGDPSPDALLDVEGGTVRFSDYGTGVSSGQRTFLLGVDSDGDVITVDTSSVGTDNQIIDALFISNDTLFISLEDDGVSDLFVNLAPYLVDVNIYEADDTLSSNRTVNMDGNYLQFSNSDGRTRTRIEDDGTLTQVGRNISHTLTDTSQDVQLELSAQGAFSTIGNASDHNLNIVQNNTTAISVKTDDYIQFSNYGGGNRTGTPAYIIGIDIGGNLLDVDLSTIGSDNQTIDTFSINGSNILQLSLENDGEPAQTVDLSPYLDDQTVTITGAGINAVTGTYPNFTITGTEVDGSVSNETLTNFAYTTASGQLRITESGSTFLDTISVMLGATVGIAGVRGLVPEADAGEQDYLLTGAGTWVDPSSIGSDNQIIDSLALTGSELQIGIENDANGLQTLDLSSLQGGSVGVHSDVDVTTIAPGSGDVLAWDGSNFVPQETDNGYTIFSVWAEENSSLLENETEWAFGNGGNTNVGHGILIPVDCELWAMSLDHEDGVNTIVRAVKNAVDTLSAYQISTTGVEQDYISFGTPLTFSAGDIINFKTISASLGGTSGRVSAWFRIRATPASNSLLEDLMDVSASGISSGQILVYNGGSFVPGDDSDEQEIDSFELTGNILAISLENDGVTPLTIDLSTITGSSENIYNTNDSLESDRTVTLDSNSLTFDGSGAGDIVIEADGDVGIGTTSPGARLEVAGGSVIFDEYGVGTYADTSAKYILATDTLGNVVELNTAKNTRWFYPPAIIIDASSLDTMAFKELHADYVQQFTMPLVSSDGAIGNIPYYLDTELEYYVTYYDDTVLANVSIDATGRMTYDIIAVPFDNYTVINVVFVIKDP